MTNYSLFCWNVEHSVDHTSSFEGNINWKYEAPGSNCSRRNGALAEKNGRGMEATNGEKEQRKTEESGKVWIQRWKRRRSAARNKRNLTWRPAHFLNGMFPLPLRDIMHRLWITDGKIALRLSLPRPLFFVPSPSPSTIVRRNAL